MLQPCVQAVGGGRRVPLPLPQKRDKKEFFYIEKNMFFINIFVYDGILLLRIKEFFMREEESSHRQRCSRVKREEGEEEGEISCLTVDDHRAAAEAEEAKK